MENLKTYIGIDISKNTLDIWMDGPDQKHSHFCIDNKKADIRRFFKKHAETAGLEIAMENTGRYNWSLYDVLPVLGLDFYLLNPLDLKRSLGLARGKSDKADASRIAAYIRRNGDAHQHHKVPPQAVRQLKTLLSERDSLANRKRQVKTKMAEVGLLKFIELDVRMRKLYKKEIQFLGEQIAKIEHMIEQTMQTDKSMITNFKLLVSIPGVGKIVAWYLLAKTENFAKIKTARKFACFAGVSPFSKQSGLFKGRDRLSSFADKQMKKMLHLAALSTIRLENNLAHYYHRKVAEGKNKMSALNAVRNKIVHIAYAVIKNQKKYENNLLLS